MLVAEESFRIAGYHRRRYPEDETLDIAQGLVVTVKIEFELWLESRPLEAEAFLDPGADCTLISYRWIREQAEAASASATRKEPKMDPDGVLVEGAHLSIGALRLPLGDLDRPVSVVEQEGEVPQMSGYEDLLLGRDFMTQHGLFIAIDGEKRRFMVLAPVDEANRGTRDEILAMLSRGRPPLD